MITKTQVLAKLDKLKAYSIDKIIDVDHASDIEVAEMFIKS